MKGKTKPKPQKAKVGNKKAKSPDDRTQADGRDYPRDVAAFSDDSGQAAVWHFGCK